MEGDSILDGTKGGNAQSAPLFACLTAAVPSVAQRPGSLHGPCEVIRLPHKGPVSHGPRGGSVILESVQPLKGMAQFLSRPFLLPSTTGYWDLSCGSGTACFPCGRPLPLSAWLLLAIQMEVRVREKEAPTLGTKPIATCKERDSEGIRGGAEAEGVVSGSGKSWVSSQMKWM